MEPIELAGCVILDDYGRMLLIHRSHGALSHWELPGGKIEPNETSETAAARELSEGLDVAVQIVGDLGSGVFEQDDQEYHWHWFQAVLGGKEPVIMDMAEYDDLGYFELEDLPSLALSPNMLELYPKIDSGEVALDTSLF